MIANRFTLQSRLIFTVLLPCMALLFVGSSGLKSMLDIRDEAQHLYPRQKRASSYHSSTVPQVKIQPMKLLDISSLD
ncbi:hypothetical protein EDB47_11790 [Vibrio crassostreae]|uniref:Uncharacterized protein n=1 Tax=Vibrio crassostreae TaxID=246167 RepID=A0A822MSN0_9VIBR|nr:hypothetical protein EDB35_11667 [Vibrio crassostreae]TCT54164.1 hypothetical protein EDB40_11451 [Vibrio crassostreae]TCU01593.1 hypothetical protein EDB47_11790 [Vibrio crassostreae]TCU02361.1 hypothetical protein EDB32_1325 [Vibrio crassostreae]CDT00559.1 exported hypothetical protein [Vibrio crassostreae]